MQSLFRSSRATRVRHSYANSSGTSETIHSTPASLSRRRDPILRSGGMRTKHRASPSTIAAAAALRETHTTTLAPTKLAGSANALPWASFARSKARPDR